MVWCDMQLGPQGSPRPDVYTIRRSFKSPCPTAYEVKVSVSDFRGDVTAGKYNAYYQYAGAVVFACERGLLGKADIPPQCGLIVLGETGWHHAKKSTVRPCTLPQDAVIKLLIDGVSREGACVRANAYASDRSYREFSRKFGAEAARWVGDMAGLKERLARAEDRERHTIQRGEEQAAQHRRDSERAAQECWRALTDALGLPPDTSSWVVRRKAGQIAAMAADPAACSEVGKAINYLARVQGELERIRDAMPVVVEERQMELPK